MSEEDEALLEETTSTSMDLQPTAGMLRMRSSHWVVLGDVVYHPLSQITLISMRLPGLCSTSVTGGLHSGSRGWTAERAP